MYNQTKSQLPMQGNSTFYKKNLTNTIDSEALKAEEKSPKLSVIQSLLNYSKSLEFKKSNYVKQVELVLN